MTILKHYKCIKSNNENCFAVGEIYPLYNGDTNYIVSNNNVKWFEYEFPVLDEQMGVKLEEQKEMKFKVFDLNNLTTSELREYVDLLEEKEKAEFLLECFIEKVSK